MRGKAVKKKFRVLGSEFKGSFVQNFGGSIPYNPER